MEINTPNWVKNAVFYQIFPDRFAKNTISQPTLWPSNNLEKWETPPTYNGYKGGNLWGIIEKLDYLQDLGINAIYFTPIFQSACNHRYHTHDYYQIDPLLGGNDAFEALLKESHQRNIKVVLDGVFNHASRGFFFFNDILENGSNSPWLDWFKIEGWPLSPYDGDKPANYASWVGYRALPQFNHDNPQVREYLMQIGEYWVKKGIDGWRLDVPFEIKTPNFWQEFRTRIKAINSEAYIVGEVWNDSRQWLDGTQFDGVMNYLFTGPTIAFTAGDRVKMEYVEKPDYFPYPAISASEYAQKMEQLLSLYPWEIQLTQLNLLDSHDTARLITVVGGDRPSVELSTILLMTFPGAPSIYYGDEVGLEGGFDPDCRRGFPNRKYWDIDVLNYHKYLIKLRQKYQALRTGDYKILYAESSLYVFARTLEQEEIIVAINTDIHPKSAQFFVDKINSKPAKIIYGKAEISWQNNDLKIELPPRSGCIIV